MPRHRSQMMNEFINQGFYVPIADCNASTRHADSQVLGSFINVASLLFAKRQEDMVWKETDESIYLFRYMSDYNLEPDVIWLLPK